MSRRFAAWIVGLVVLTSGLRVLSSTPSPAKEVLATYPLDALPLNVYFERRMDWDRSEHASLIMVFSILNRADSTVCEIWGSGVLEAAGFKRSVGVWDVKKLIPGETREISAPVRLDKNDSENVILRAVHLKQIVIRWVTEKVKMCDGTIYLAPSPSPSVSPRPN
jgi:hypothetical protein